MKTYVALLRGINVGGHTIKMPALKEAFENAGMKEVRTLLASGNVIFQSTKENSKELAKELREHLTQSFGYDIDTILLDQDEVLKIIKSEPFRGIPVTPMTRLYLTFLAEPTHSQLKTPYVSPEKDYTILKVQDDVIYSHLELIQRGTIDAMNILEKEFGKRITTRNWNTIVRIGKLLV